MLETDRLQERSRINLIFGASTSVVGVMVLFFVLFVFPPLVDQEQIVPALLAYLPRLTLVIIIEIVSTFFFRMYVSNESDIKQNKNELTNIELRLAAALMTVDNKDARASIAVSLVNEERNFILKKGEKVAGETRRMGANIARDVIAKVSERVGGSK